MTDTTKRWGFLHGNTFIPVPREPLLAAGYETQPFDVVLPTGAVRRIVEEPDGSEPIGTE